MLEEFSLPREFSWVYFSVFLESYLGRFFCYYFFAANMGLYVMEGVDPFFVVFGLEGVSLKAGANTFVSVHACRLHWSESVLPGLYECQKLKNEEIISNLRCLHKSEGTAEMPPRL